MVVLTIEVDGKEKSLYMDGQLHHQLIKVVRPAVRKKDFDYVLAIDGEEGSGKSVFAMQIAKILDSSFNLSQLCFTPQEFIKKVVRAKAHQCIVFDEAFTGLSSRSSLSEMNQLLVTLMMEMRQKNLFIILVMPSFFMFDKYAVLHRAKGLFHVYLRKGRRGVWKFYNKRRMKLLYLKGKKYFDYTVEKQRMFGRFADQYTVNEEEYRERKKESLNKKQRKTRADVYKEQRDTLFYILVKGLRKSKADISRLCKKYGYVIDRRTINIIILDKTREYLIGESKD